jgi:DNA-binding MarR family transcriptional regulator
MKKKMSEPLAQNESVQAGEMFDRDLEIELSTRVLRQFRQVFNSVKSHFQQIEKKVGVGGAQSWALSVIHKHPGMGTTELARALDIHQSTASNLIRSLVSAGLITTEKSSTDRRAVQLFIMPEGQKLLKKIPGPHAGILPHALTALDQEVLLRLNDDLGSLLKLIQADEKLAQIPLGLTQK